MKKHEEVISTSEAKEILGVTIQRVNQLIEANRFPGAIKSGKFWLLPRNEVIAVAKASGDYNANVKRKKEKK